MSMDGRRMHELACAYARAPGKEALSAALEAALPLCALIARRFSGRGAEYEDLYQVACLACAQAVKSFDPALGVQFSSFVTPTLAGAARNYIRDHGALLRTPRTAYEQSARLNRAREQFFSENRREPTPRELAERLRWPAEQVLSVLMACAARQVASLDAEDPQGAALSQRLFAEEAGFEQSERRQDLRKAMALLSPRETAILALRYREKCSQRETARRMGMSQMQVSRAEKRALAALRKEMSP